jgi:hypothetical protein
VVGVSGGTFFSFDFPQNVLDDCEQTRNYLKCQGGMPGHISPPGYKRSQCCNSINQFMVFLSKLFLGISPSPVKLSKYFINLLNRMAARIRGYCTFYLSFKRACRSRYPYLTLLVSIFVPPKLVLVYLSFQPNA